MLSAFMGMVKRSPGLAKGGTLDVGETMGADKKLYRMFEGLYSDDAKRGDYSGIREGAAREAVEAFKQTFSDNLGDAKYYNNCLKTLFLGTNGEGRSCDSPEFKSFKKFVDHCLDQFDDATHELKVSEAVLG